MLAEGKINIAVIIKDNMVANIDISSSRFLYISQYLQGKKISEAGKLIDTFYHLCPTAHNFAYLKLLNSAKQISLSENELLAYQLLLNLETIKEHCFTIFSRWQHNLSTEISHKVMSILQIVKQIRLELFSGVNPFSLQEKTLQQGKNIKTQIKELERQLLALLVDDNADIFADINKFNSWLKDSNSCVAVFLKYLQKNNYHNLANVQTYHLPKNIAQNISKFLLDKNFIKKPFYSNKTYETTPLSRQHNTPLIKQLSNIYGDGLLTRATAQVLDIFVLLDKVKDNYLKITKQNICYDNNVMADKTNAIVELEAARGRLIHQINIENSHIIDYQILAPTEWNFHHQGILFEMIKTLSYKNDTEFKTKVSLCVNAIDPCVGFNVEIKYA